MATVEDSNLKFDFTAALSGNAIRVYGRKSKEKNKSGKEYYELSVYKATSDTLRLLINKTYKAPPHIKDGLVLDTERDLVSLVRLILKAANSVDKEDILKEAYEIARKIQISIRLFYDSRFMGIDGFADVSSRSEDIVRQLNGWYKSIINKQIKALD